MTNLTMDMRNRFSWQLHLWQSVFVSPSNIDNNKGDDGVLQKYNLWCRTRAIQGRRTTRISEHRSLTVKTRQGPDAAPPKN